MTTENDRSAILETMNLERLISRSLSTPRKVRMDIRRSIQRRPTGNLRYSQLTEHLATAMIRGYQLGHRRSGAVLRRESRKAKLAEYKRRASAVLDEYGESATREVSSTYRNARAKGASVKAATILALRRLGTLGHSAPAVNRLKALYNSAIRSAHEQGVFDSTIGDSSVWGYSIVTHTDDRVRDSHLQFNKITLPRTHEFWRQIGTPPWGWNCRCRLKVYKRKQKIVRPPPNLIPIDEDFRGNDFGLR